MNSVSAANGQKPAVSLTRRQEATLTIKGQTGSVQQMAPMLKKEIDMGKALANWQTRDPNNTRDFVSVVTYCDAHGKRIQDSPEGIFQIIQQNYQQEVPEGTSKSDSDKSNPMGVIGKLLDPIGLFSGGGLGGMLKGL